MWKQDTCASRPFGDGAGHIENRHEGGKYAEIHGAGGCTMEHGFFFIGIGTGQKHEKGGRRKRLERLYRTPIQQNAGPKANQTLNTLNGKVVPAQRGEILLFVFFRPGDGLSGQITFTGGYPFAKKAVEIDIDGTKYSLPTIDDRWAWAVSNEDDKKILDAAEKRWKGKNYWPLYKGQDDN